MGIGGVGQAGTAAATAAVDGPNAAVGVAMLRKSLDASEGVTGQLLASLPKSGQTVGGTLDIRM